MSRLTASPCVVHPFHLGPPPLHWKQTEGTSWEIPASLAIDVPLPTAYNDNTWNCWPFLPLKRSVTNSWSKAYRKCWDSSWGEGFSGESPEVASSPTYAGHLFNLAIVVNYTHHQTSPGNNGVQINPGFLSLQVRETGMCGDGVQQQPDLLVSAAPPSWQQHAWGTSCTSTCTGHHDQAFVTLHFLYHLLPNLVHLSLMAMKASLHLTHVTIEGYNKQYQNVTGQTFSTTNTNMFLQLSTVSSQSFPRPV